MSTRSTLTALQERLKRNIEGIPGYAGGTLQEQLRRNMAQTPGFAGGTLQGQLDRDQNFLPRPEDRVPPKPVQSFDDALQEIIAQQQPQIPLGGMSIGGPAPTPVSALPVDPALATRMRRAVPAEAIADPEASHLRSVEDADSALTQRLRRRFAGEPISADTNKPLPSIGQRSTISGAVSPLTSRMRRHQEATLALPQPEAFGSNGEPFTPARERRTQPRDYVAEDSERLRELENQTDPKWKRMALAGITGLSTALNGQPPPKVLTPREQEIERLKSRVGRALEIENARSGSRYKDAQSDWMDSRPDIENEKIKTQRVAQQQRVIAGLLNRMEEFDPDDPENADLVQAVKDADLPVIKKSRSQQLRYVQDARTGEWHILSGDRSTGQAVSTPVGTSEGDSLATTPTAQITAETADENRSSRERVAGQNQISRESVAALNRQSREAVSALNRQARERVPGGSKAQARMAKAAADITELENLKTAASIAAGTVADQATRDAALQKAATKAAEIRQIYSDLVEVGYGRDSEGRMWPYAKLKTGTQSQGQPARAGGLTEAQVREHARQKNLNADELVRRARAAGDIP